MPNYIATADGNLSAGATWAATAEFADGESNSTVLTTSYVESQAFTPGAVTIDGIAVKIAARAAVPSGTMSIRLAQAGVLVAGTEVTVDVQDIQGTLALQNGWMFLKFAAPVLLVVATNYTVSAKTSVATMVTLYRTTATAGNWSRALRSTTTGVAPIAGDLMFILGEWTAAGTKTDRTVTMDSTAATDFGNASTTLASFGISYGGTLTWGVTAATQYILRLSGLLDVWIGGTLNMGTIASPCPRDSSLQLEFDCATDGDFGLRVWGIWNGQGQSRISGSTNHYVLLNTDEAAGQTVLGTDSQLSARSGDSIAIGTTTRTNTQCEERVLTGDAGASSLTVTVGLTNAHSGTSPTQGELIVLNRDVRVRSVSTSAMAYVQVNQGATVDCDWVEFRYVGNNSAGKRAIDISATSGSIVFTKCSVRDTEHIGFYASATAGVAAFQVVDCVFWNVTAGAVHVIQATDNAWTITGCVAMSISTGFTAFYVLDLGGTMTNCRVAGGQICYRFDETITSVPQKINGTFNNLIGHGANSIIFQIDNIGGGTLSNLTAWRGTNTGFAISGNVSDLTVDGLTCFGNTTTNAIVNASLVIGNLYFKRLTFNGDSSFATTNGFTVNSQVMPNLMFEDCSFGVVNGILIAHSTNDILLSTSPKFFELTLVDCILASPTEIANLSSTNVGKCFVAYQKHEGVALANSTVWPIYGTDALDTVTFRTASPSEKLTPSGAVAGARFQSNWKSFAVGSGQSLTVSVYVNKSGLYTGSAPRLRVMENAAAGIVEATVATLVGSAGSWIQLQGTIGPVTEDCWLTVYVDCDGSAGQVNVDDYTSSVA